MERSGICKVIVVDLRLAFSLDPTRKISQQPHSPVLFLRGASEHNREIGFGLYPICNGSRVSTQAHQSERVAFRMRARASDPSHDRLVCASKMLLAARARAPARAGACGLARPCSFMRANVRTRTCINERARTEVHA